MSFSFFREIKCGERERERKTDYTFRKCKDNCAGDNRKKEKKHARKESHFYHLRGILKLCRAQR